MGLLMAERIRHIKIGSFQPDIESLLKLTPEDFALVTDKQKNEFASETKSTSYFQKAWSRLKQNKVATAALIVLILIILFAFAGPVFVPYGYGEFVAGSENLYPYHYSLDDQALMDSALGDYDTRLSASLEEAKEEKGSELSSIEIAKIKAEVTHNSENGKEFKKENNIHLKPFGYSNDELKRIEAGEKVFPHVFGTDKYGRDIMVRLMIGTRVSLLVGIFASLLVLIIGAVYGSISGFAGGRVDAIMMRIVELIYATPEMLIVLLISTALKPNLIVFQNSGSGIFQSLVGLAGPNLISMFVAFGLIYWVPMARVIRGQILQLKEQEFVTAAKALGASPGRIILRHLLPNCVGQIIVTACLQIPAAIFLESFMSYLGVGVTAPMTSLGSMASDALSGIETYSYRLVIPALLLSIIILALNLLGDGLRDAFDPRLKK